MSIDPHPSAGNGAPIRKFMFERAFDAPKKEKIKEPPKPVFSEEQLNAAREEAYREGLEAGQNAAKTDNATKQNALLETVQQELLKITTTLSGRQADADRETAEIAMAITERLLPDFCSRNGLSEIQAMIQTVIRDLSKEPRIVVRVCDAHFDVLEKWFDDIKEKNAFQNQVIVLADPSLGNADCRVEWADGGILKSEETFWNDLAKSILKGQGMTPSRVDAGADQPPPTSTTTV